MGPALLLAATAGGLALTFAPGVRLSGLARLAAGVCIGMAVLGLVGFALASLLGLRPLTLALSALLAAAPALLLTRPAWRARARSAAADAQRVVRAALASPLRTLPVLLYGVMLAALLWRVFDRAYFLTPQGLHTADDHNLGDLPFHLAIASGFARGDNFPPEHPELAGVRLTYPFLVDLVPALLTRAGTAMRSAFLIQNVLLALALAVLLIEQARSWTSERTAALAAPLLVFFSGGLGFLLLGRDVAAGEGVLAWLGRLPQDYTMRAEAGLRWGNGLTTLLVTQRSLLMGLPLFVLVCILWWRALRQDGEADTPRSALMAASGVAAGLLPLVHAHSFAALLGLAACLALLFPRREWLAFFAGSLALALPQVAWLAGGTALKPARFLAWQVGWDRGERDPVSFWLWNTGAFLPLLVAALAWRGGGGLVTRERRRFYAPFVLLFLVPNLLRLSPWIWDNIKFLFLWYVASVPAVLAVLGRLWQGRLASRMAALVLLASMTLAGALDVWRVARPVREHAIFDADDLVFAERIAALTPPRALVLHAPTYDTPVLLSGRRSLLGYPGHIWSQGFDAGPRQAQIEHVYAGGPESEALLSRWGVDHVVVGPHERRAYDVSPALLERLSLVADLGRHRLYRVR